MSETPTTPVEAREQIETLTSELTETRAALEAAQSELRQHQAKDTFAEAGFETKFADLYLAANPDGKITTEAVSEWAEQYSLAPVEGDGHPKPTQEVKVAQDGSEKLDSLGRGGSSPQGQGQPPGPDDTMSIQEWEGLQQRDPDAAAQAVADGKVRLRGDNPFVRGYRLGANPYQNRGESESQS